ncbi:DUF3696 domain-containing protein [Saccharicrinis fermentans]|uniref:AAA domain-containing protein n=1 Tax=Saccharicrinis fermentans DSM 9555 = JCM 21142 TaxID=869213 RepID=W7YJF3_9BACT|nr:DUF3696 domain-containing protein [Saccharicrinis fermentans]GAF04636.1 hypothetical protein JCM21142_93348 [Saccharicrinis fermentans DSM 9555 = JCM 21142]
MINKIGIQNFRIFQNLQSFNLDKINILTGTNGVGKSTFKNGFRLLKEVLAFDKKQRLISFNNLNLSPEQKLIFGSFKANISYESISKGFKFSFGFNHTIFGDLTADLQLDIHDFEQDTLLPTQLSFYKQDQLLADFINEYDYREENGFWGVNQSSIEHIIPRIHEALIAYKDLMHEQEGLCLLDKKLTENEILTTKETALYEKYLAMGYVFNAFNIDEEKHKIATGYGDDKIKDQRPSTILSPDGNYFEPIDNRSNFLDDDFTDVSGLLFNTTLLTLVIKANTLEVLNNNKYKILYEELLKENVKTVEDFKSLYKDFEKEVLYILFKELLPGISTSFLELLSPCKNIPSAPIDGDIKNPIFKALLEAGDLDWKCTYRKVLGAEEEEEISNVGKNKYNQSKDNKSTHSKDEEDFRFHKTLRYLTDIYKSIALEFSRQLYSLLDKSIFAHSDLSFSNNYFLPDINKDKNPFLLFGSEYLDEFHYESSNTIKFINKWLKEFDIADEIEIKPIIAGDEKIGITYFLKVNDKERPLINYGRGINQFVCNLLAFCTNRVNVEYSHNTVFLEEPEVNLHPSFQSKLAEMVTDATQKFNCSVVIETHSEYFIRKFQYLVASPEYPVRADDVSISYLYHPDKIPQGKKQVEKLIIEEDGGLDGEFGKGFFDEASNWKRELMRLKHAQKN